MIRILVAVLLVCAGMQALADDKAPASIPREKALEIALATAQNENLALQVAALQKQIEQAQEEVKAALAARDRLLREYQIAPSDYGRTVAIDLKACAKGLCPIRRSTSERAH